jgi:hypothetical protein
MDLIQKNGPATGQAGQPFMALLGFVPQPNLQGMLFWLYGAGRKKPRGGNEAQCRFGKHFYIGKI